MSNRFIKGIIGDGFLTEIILTAFTRQIGISPEDTYVLAQTSGRCQELLEQYNVHAVQNSMVFIPASQIVILAVEDTASINDLMLQISRQVNENALIISVVQGLKLSTIEKYFPNHMVIRMIMNPWVVSGFGVSTYIAGKHHNAEAANIARALLTSLGETVEVDTENELEIVGELILSETVYSYLTVKALIGSGKRAGLSLDKSKELVFKILTSSTTAISSADSLAESVIERSHGQTDYLEKGRQLMEKYNILQNFQQSFADPIEAKDVLRFHYHF